MFTILVVEDNSDMRELFCTVLSDSGYRCLSASDGLEALEVMDREYVDLIVADIMMSGMDGYEMTRALREAKMDLPVLMVTAKDQFDDLKKGFRSGADDYMVKPINVKELVLRVEALLRRAKIQSEKRIVVGNTVLDYDALTVTIHGEETTLPQKEFYLLYKLLSYPNKIFTRPQLMDEIWGMFSETDERIAEIREMSQRFNAMAFDLSHIETLRSDFVVNVSHEFKTPIAAIEGYAMLLQNPALSGERHGHYVEKYWTIPESCPPFQATFLCFRSWKIVRLCRSTTSTGWTNRSERRFCGWKTGGRISSWSWILICRCRCIMDVNRFWSNILDNAVKHAPCGSTIAVSLLKKEKDIVVRISDQGEGMSAEVQKHIFEKFYQGDSSRRAEGNGLGLALVKRILDLCGGVVQVESAPGKGTSFFVTLPEA